MAFFDKLKKAPESNTKQTGSSDAACAQKQVFIFEDLPESLAQMQAMPEAALKSALLEGQKVSEENCLKPGGFGI